MDFNTFLLENYVWIIVGVIIVVMTIIGYIADKTDFGNKKEKPVKKQKESNIEKIEEPVLEETADASAFEEEKIDEDPEIDYTQEISPVAPLDDFEMPEESGIEQENISEEPSSLEEPVVLDDNMNEELQQEDNNISFDEAVSEEMPDSIEEEVSEPVDNVFEEIKEDENSELNSDEQSDINTEESESLNEQFELPNIDKLNEEIADVEQEEDVWKF